MTYFVFDAFRVALSARMGFALLPAVLSLIWLWCGKGRPSESDGWREQFSWMSSVLVLVDACFLITTNHMWAWETLFYAMTPLLVAQMLLRHFMRCPAGPPSPAP